MGGGFEARIDMALRFPISAAGSAKTQVAEPPNLPVEFFLKFGFWDRCDQNEL